MLDSTRVGNVGRYINHSCNVRTLLPLAPVTMQLLWPLWMKAALTSIPPAFDAELMSRLSLTLD